MKPPTIEKCKHCGEIKSTVWSEIGFEVTQKHKLDCPILAELKAKYPQK